MEQGKKLVVSMLTLGCKVNQYETQALKEQFIAAGYEIADTEGYADIYVINTCTVTGLSDRKSRQFIRRAKRLNPESITAVIGCYAQVSPEEACSIEGVNIVAGTNEKNHLLEYIERYKSEKKRNKEGGHGPSIPSIDCYIKSLDELTDYEETGIITSMDSRTRAFIKVQEGCDRFCSYCIIPYARGPVRSRSASEIVKEAKTLIEQGFKEIVLTGINTALYGTELGFSTDYPATVKGGEAKKNPKVYGIEIIVNLLNELDGEFRIRLGSLEPTVINGDYVKRLLNYEKLCPHLHLSLQSGSDRILKLMERNYDTAQYLQITDILKDHDSGYGITTDIIVGFPGETEVDFADTIKMAEAAGFCKVHVFSYSKRKKTKAAQMAQHISPEVKARRNALLTEVSNRVSKDFFVRNIGVKRTVLVERFDEKTELLEGFSENYIKVYFKGSKTLLNQFVKVEIKECYRDGVKGLLFF